MKTQFNIFKDIDKPILFLYLVMVVIGWFSIYAAAYDESHTSIFDLGTSYGKQLIWIVSAFVIGTAVLMLDPKFFSSFAWIIYGFFLLMLVAVLFVGVEINATKAWFHLGGFVFQPSEVAKYATALALATAINRSRTRQPGIRNRLLVLAVVALPAALVLLQKDVGTTLVFSSLVLVLYREGYVGGLVLFFIALAAALFVLTLILNEFIIIGVLAIISAIIIFFIRKKTKAIAQMAGLFVLISLYVYSVDFAFDNILEAHHRSRIEVLVHGGVDLQGAGYNLHQSKIAIGSGGLFGKGYLNGTQTKFNFVPEQTTDFIFCTVGEEWGFIGSIIIVGLYALLLTRIIFLAERQKSTFSRTFGYATASILFFHFAVNMGMTIGLVPVIGIPLPLISYGGSSLWGITLFIFTFLKLDSKKLDLL